MIFRVLIYIFLPIVSTVLILFWMLIRSSDVNTRGDFYLNGINQPVSILRDVHGTVFIESENDDDAFFAMGYAQAQDRLWQLEVQKRIAKGSMSEIFGKATFRQDTLMRTLGLYPSAEKAWSYLSTDARNSLNAFARGINAWIDQQLPLPPEFLIHDIKPEPWTPIDSIAWIKVFAFSLGGNYLQEMEHYAAASVLDQQQLITLYPALDEVQIQNILGNNHKLIEQNQQFFALKNTLLTDMKIGGKFVGSNAWVVSGSKTSSGLPVLANDPHLGLQIPSLWYSASLKGQSINSAGMALVGLPVIIFGRNKAVGWGGTNLGADVQDLFVEQQGLLNQQEYLVDGKWQSMLRRVESIKVKADFPAFMRKAIKPVEIEIRQTRNGPVISDIFSVVGSPVSMRWTALDDDDTSYEAFYLLNYAENWDEFTEAASYLVAPALNLLYADVNDNIGYLVAGRIPKRKSGKGLVPVAGWESSNQWNGYLNSTDLPRIFNPPEGYIVSANDQAYDSQYPHFISAQWAPSARADRIKQLLQQKLKNSGKIKIEDHVTIQGDVLDLAIQSIMPTLRRLKCENEQQCKAMAYINNWNGQMLVDEIAPSIVSVWIDKLRLALLGDEFKSYWQKGDKKTFLGSAIGNITISRLVDMMTDNQSRWCDDVTTDELEDCQIVLSQSLDSTLDEIAKLVGSDISNWQWGELHSTLYSHTPMSNVQMLKGFFERRIPNGGSVNSVNVANASFEPSQGYVQTFGAGFRQIMVIGKDDSPHWLMNGTGQSGHFLSPHYDDMIGPFNRLQFNLLEAPEGAEKQQLNLCPMH